MSNTSGHHQSPSATDALQTLSAWIASAGPNMSAYALIDMAAMSQEQHVSRVLQHIRAAGAVSVLGDARPQAELATPWLMPLTANQEQNRKLLTTTWNWALRGPSVTWLSSQLPATELATRLRRRTEAVLPQNQPILLRCYDPRVLPELHKVLHPNQADSYWALGHTWAYLDRAQQVRFIALSHAPDVDRFEAPMSLDQNQFETLLDASEVDSVMPELAREVPSPFLALPPDQRTAFTQRCLSLADEWQVQAFAQRVMVCVLALRLGEDFHQQAAWAPWIGQLKQGQIGLIEAIEKATTP